MYALAGMHLGWTPDELFVEYPKWIAKQPRSYREKVAAYLTPPEDAATRLLEKLERHDGNSND